MGEYTFISYYIAYSMNPTSNDDKNLVRVYCNYLYNTLNTYKLGQLIDRLYGWTIDDLTKINSKEDPYNNFKKKVRAIYHTDRCDRNRYIISPICKLIFINIDKVLPEIPIANFNIFYMDNHKNIFKHLIWLLLHEIDEDDDKRYEKSIYDFKDIIYSNMFNRSTVNGFTQIDILNEIKSRTEREYAMQRQE